MSYRLVTRLEESTPVAGQWREVATIVVQHYRDFEHAKSAHRVAAQAATATVKVGKLAAGTS